MQSALRFLEVQIAGLCGRGRFLWWEWPLKITKTEGKEFPVGKAWAMAMHVRVGCGKRAGGQVWFFIETGRT